MSISVCIIAKNEEATLDRCLASVKTMADEIVLIDDDSTDATLNIAKKHHAKIYKRKLDTFCNQKNYAAHVAKSEWIFSIDADETCPPELANEILSVTKNQEADGYLIPRKNIMLGAEIKYTRWSPDMHIWLFKKSKAKWVGDIHEEVIVEGTVGTLKNAKVHHSYETISEFFSMMNNYTSRIADEMVKNKINYSFFKLIWYTKRSFIGRYLLKQGYKDGWRGFVLSYMMGIYRMTTWVKLWERYQNTR